MLKSRLMVSCACAGCVALSGAAQAEIEISGYLKNETAVYTRGGASTGQAQNALGKGGHDQGELLKFENTVRTFVNGDLTDDSTWHAELQFVHNSEGVNADYVWPRQYTQTEVLRELYADTSFGDWDLRLGKQQVVWGTADGIKLLDIINPTDWREFNQNTMDESRIPVWMVNAERNIGESGNIQFIISQHEENKIAGLNENGDYGHPFVFKGVDTITGRVNGFFNIAPAFGRIAKTFDGLAPAAGLNGLFAALPISATVQNFVNADNPAAIGFGAVGCGAVGLPSNIGSNGNAQCLNDIMQTVGVDQLAGTVPMGGNNNITNSIDGGVPTGGKNNAFWDVQNPNSAFEYFPDTSFGTFDSFVNLDTQYIRDYPDDANLNYGFRYKAYTDGGTSYSLNYFYAYDSNPSVNISMHTPTGMKVFPVVDAANNNVIQYHSVPNAGPDAPGAPSATRHCSATEQIDIQTTTIGVGGPGTPRPAAAADVGCTLRFTESLSRIHNIGASFDTTFDNIGPVPVVMRGEFLYQKDVNVPIIDRGELAIGNITQALKSEKADFFKYVIGFDVTVMTNLFVSTQFIQFINLDFVDEASSRNADINAARAANGSAYLGNANYRRYTGHMPSLALDNGLNIGEEYESFVSLFFSKPFGDAQEHRWNNIMIFEERGGWWNRFDFEYAFSDEVIGTFEWNQYWGSEDYLFGQFEKSSNLQLGVRYIF